MCIWHTSQVCQGRILHSTFYYLHILFITSNFIFYTLEYGPMTSMPSMAKTL